MQKLQVTMSEMDELRRPTRVHSGESSAYPSDMGLVRSIRLQQRVPRPGNNELNHDQASKKPKDQNFLFLFS